MILNLIGCRSTESYVEGSLSNFSDSHVVGMWEAYYDLNGGVEVLTLNNDKSYLQIYEDVKGYLYTGVGNWEIETDASGRVFITLLNALWFPLGSKQALLKGMDPSPNFSGQPHHFFDHDTNNAIQMLELVRLEVIPRANRKGFVLFHFAWDIDSAPELFEPVIK